MAASSVLAAGTGWRPHNTARRRDGVLSFTNSIAGIGVAAACAMWIVALIALLLYQQHATLAVLDSGGGGGGGGGGGDGDVDVEDDGDGAVVHLYGPIEPDGDVDPLVYTSCAAGVCLNGGLCVAGECQCPPSMKGALCESKFGRPWCVGVPTQCDVPNLPQCNLCAHMRHSANAVMAAAVRNSAHGMADVCAACAAAYAGTASLYLKPHPEFNLYFNGATVTRFPLRFFDRVNRQAYIVRNLLPNYYTRRLQRGIGRKTYKFAVPLFQHVHKAAGGLVKQRIVQHSYNHGGVPWELSVDERCRWDVQMSRRERGRYTLLFGDYALGACNNIEKGRLCRAFTIVRDPIERMVSDHAWCSQHRPDGDALDQLCGHAYRLKHGLPLASELSLVEWARFRGNHMLESLFFDVHTADCVVGSPEHATHRYNPLYHRFELGDRVTLAEAQTAVLNIENWFAFVGLYDELELSLEMAAVAMDLQGLAEDTSSADNLARHHAARAVDTDASADGDGDGGSADGGLTAAVRAELHEVLALDYMYYNAARELFERQRAAYNALQRRND